MIELEGYTNYCINQNITDDFTSKSQQFDKNAYQNDINNRMSQFRTSENIHLKRLPFNNNIRDYSITVDSKKMNLMKIIKL